MQGQDIVLAALLHDIGKICFRADKSKGNHSQAGRDFLKANFSDNYAHKQKFLECVANHHASALAKANLEATHPAYIIYEADNIASGTDRRPEENSAVGFDHYAALESIFNLLNGKSPQTKKHLLKSLGKDEKINYPVELGTAQKSTAGDYQKILQEFSSNLKRVKFEELSVNALLKISEHLTSFIPSSTNKAEVCDISLYDHQKITAAVAGCMYEYFQEHNITDYKQECYGSNNKNFRQKKIFKLVAGDFSGIQDFIYTIKSRGALKNLRGRSFYLEMLNEHIVDEILTKLNLNRSNLIYAGGGHFYILAANVPATEACIELAQEKINDWLLEKYGNSLYLQLASVDCTPLDLMYNEQKNSLGALYQQLSIQLNEGKINRYSEAQLAKMFTSQSSLNKLLDKERECAICHTSSKKLSKYQDYKNQNDTANSEDIEVCPTCKSLYSLGHAILAEESIFAVIKNAGELELPGLEENLAMCVVKDIDLEQFQKTNEVVRIYVKNKAQVSNNLATHLFVGDYISKNQAKNTMDFAELASKSGGIDGAGIKRLGVMRADVDSLGATFMTGFVQDNSKDKYRYVTLSRQAVLSRQLSMFFKKHINNLCKGELLGEDKVAVKSANIFAVEKTAKQRLVNIVYAGGDDMFIVGAWDELIELALDLQQAFTKYTQGKLTFSAGIALFQENFPVAQMANITACLEEQAKEYINLEGQVKNAISLFGVAKVSGATSDHTYSWPEFTEKVIAEKLQFLRINNKFLSKSFMYRLLTLLETADDRINIARLAYALARLQPVSDVASVQENYAQFRNKMYSWATDKTDRKQLLTALNLLIYALREKEETKNKGR